jgi:uncharacterized membrane protein
MQLKTTLALTFVIVAAAVLISLLAWPKMPDQMASHWNGQGEVDGQMAKPVALFFSPVLMLFVTPFFLPPFFIEPVKRMGSFLSYYAGFVVVFNLFLLAVHGWMILWNMGVQISANVIMPIGIGCLFFYVGIMVSHLQPVPDWPARWPCPAGDWRCAQTVSLKSAKLSGVLFKLAAIIALFGAVFPRYATAFIVLPVFAIVVIVLIHSIVIARRFRREASER